MVNHGSVARVTAVYALSHFVVDLVCVSTLLGWIVPGLRAWDWELSAFAIITYDMVAFCLQLPVGALLDVLGSRFSQRAALVSFVLVGCGAACGWADGAMLAVPSVGLVALGNALFHCVGGIEVLENSGERMAPAGEFISTGALGVFLGGLAGFNSMPWVPALMVVLLLACTVLVLTMVGESSEKAGMLAFSLSRRGWLAVVLLALTVGLRSYAGTSMGFPWKAVPGLALSAVIAVVAGKAVGGRLADRIGAVAASAVSLGAVALLFPASWGNVAAGIAAAFLFNFTMAITLCSLTRLLPNAKGMGFGIASFSLAIGALPALLGVRMESGSGLSVLSLVSLVMLELALAAISSCGESRGRHRGVVCRQVGRHG